MTPADAGGLAYDTDLLALANTSEPTADTDPEADLEVELEAELADFAALLHEQRTDPSASPGSSDLEATR